MAIAERLAELEKDSTDDAPPALPNPPATPQQVGFIPNPAGGAWTPLVLPPGARTPPAEDSVWAYMPAPMAGQTGPCKWDWAPMAVGAVRALSCT